MDDMLINCVQKSKIVKALWDIKKNSFGEELINS